MPLPQGGTDPWPPPDVRGHLEDARAWAAWWSGDLADLMSTSGNDLGGVASPESHERSFNLGPGHRRRFWQRRSDARDATTAFKAAHAPLAADIAETSADLLFGEAPDLTVPVDDMPKPPEPVPAAPPPFGPVPEAAAQVQMQARQQAEQEAEAAFTTKLAAARAVNDAAQAELEDLVEQVQLWPRLLEGAELAAAIGGVYLRPAWDTDLADHPLLSIVEQDRAIPDFKWGRLVAVTFWEEVETEGQKVWRHLERHEDGVILHGLYVGTRQVLGTKVGLASHPQTKGFEDVVQLPEGMPRKLSVSYVPNVLPNRRHRRKPIGRADIAGSESFLDSLDEIWSSWMRDFRLGQARVLVPDEFLQPAGTKPGDGKTFDLDTELFTGLDIAEIEKLTDPMKLIQPLLRVTDHADTVTVLVRTIVSASGWSPQTFGLDIDGAAESGTALRVREKKSLHTVNRKRGYWKPGVVDTVENLAAINAAVFGGPKIARPTLSWPDLTDDPAERAETTSIWRQAQAISIRSAVKVRAPELSEDEVDEEVELITEETKAKMPMLDVPPGEDDGSDPFAPKDDEEQEQT